jgi:hypothetical protein
MCHVPSYHSKFTTNYMGHLEKDKICTSLLPVLPDYIIFLMLLMAVTFTLQNVINMFFIVTP